MSEIEKELKRLRDERQKKFNQEDWEGALEIHDKILELSPSALRYANRGSILYRLGRLEDAISSYRQALDMDPSLKRARADLERLEAQLQKQEERPAPALDQSEYQEEELPAVADKKQQELAELRDQRQKFFAEENWPAALEVHGRILELEPTALRYANQGSILYRMGQISEAIASYQKALEMDASLEQARKDLERLQLQVEEEKLLAGPESDKDDDIQEKIDRLRKQRQEKIDKEDWEGALQSHDEIIAIEPTGLRYANRGSIMYRLGRIQESLYSFQKALELDPSLTRVQGDIARLEGQLEEEKLMSLGESETEDTMAPEQRAEKIKQLRDERQKYLDSKEWDKALAAHDEIIRIEPNALRYVNRGSMLYRMKKLPEAIVSYQKALELDPNLGRAKKDLTRMEKELNEQRAREEEEFRTKIEAEARAKAEEETRAKIEAEARAKAEEEARSQIEAEIRAQAEEAARSKAEEFRAKAEEEVRARVEAEVQAKAEKEARAQAEAEARARAEKQARVEQLSPEEIAAKLESLRQERQRLIQQEKWGEAIQIHDEILVLEPTASRYANRGSLLYRVGRVNDAILSYRQALELDPEHQRARQDLDALKESEMDRLRLQRQQKMEEDNWNGALHIHDVILALEPTALRYANRGSILYGCRALARR